MSMDISSLNPLKTLFLQQLSNVIPMGIALRITELLFIEDTSSKIRSYYFDRRLDQNMETDGSILSLQMSC